LRAAALDTHHSIPDVAPRIYSPGGVRQSLSSQRSLLNAPASLLLEKQVVDRAALDALIMGKATTSEASLKRANA
jgi:hypothetical protein